LSSYPMHGKDHMDAAAHTHKLFYDHWLGLAPIGRSPRLRAEYVVTT